MEVMYDVDEMDGSVNRTVMLSSDDQCIWCEQQYGCPLIECLANGLVFADDEFNIIDCVHYKMMDR